MDVIYDELDAIFLCRKGRPASGPRWFGLVGRTEVPDDGGEMEHAAGGILLVNGSHNYR